MTRASLLLLALAAVIGATPVRLIFDTDIGNDIDDALALAMIHAMESAGEAKLLAVTVTKDNPWAGPYVDIVNTFYGRPLVPIGTVRDGKTRDDGNYLRQVSQSGLYPHRLTSGREAPDAVLLLRQVLAGEEDGAVVIVQTGFCTNLARLLRSPPDKFSPLPGKELVRRRVRLISLMGGNFATPIGGEYNIETDIEAATSLLRESPVQIVVSGYEIGNRILFPAKSIGQDFTYVAHHPVAQAYGLYEHMPYDRPTWDLTSVLYAVRPERSFDVSEPGWMKVTSGGHLVLFPDRQGLHRYLKASDRQVDAALAVMLKLVAAPPGCRAKVCP